MCGKVVGREQDTCDFGKIYLLDGCDGDTGSDRHKQMRRSQDGLKDRQHLLDIIRLDCNHNHGAERCNLER